MMAKYRKKPVVVEAIQLTWANWSEVCEFANVGKLSDNQPEGINLDGRSSLGLHIPTLEGLMVAQENDWIIKGVKGELYPCKPDIFEQTYERAE